MINRESPTTIMKGIPNSLANLSPRRSPYISIALFDIFLQASDVPNLHFSISIDDNPSPSFHL